MNFMMVRTASLLAFLSMLFFKNPQPFAHETPEYVRFAYEARKGFIKEMEKKQGWRCVSAGTSLPYDVEELTASFNVCKKVSIDEARKLLISAIERFRTILHAHEQLLPYLRYFPLDIHDAKVFLYFVNENGAVHTDGRVAFICNNFKGDIVYKAANNGKEPGLEEKYVIYRESYDEALRILGIEQPSHISLVDKTRDACQKCTQDSAKAKRIAKESSKKEELVLARYGPGDEPKILELSCSNFCHSVVEAIREKVTGISNKYFDEEFFKRIATKELELSNGEYVEHWPNGELKVKVQWKNGRPDGHMHAWYPNCTEAFKGYFKEGLKQGAQITFFPPEYARFGSIMRCYYYNSAGQLHGEQQIMYPNDRLKALVRYANGILEGKVTLWRAEGGLLREWEYIQGKLVTPKNL